MAAPTLKFTQQEQPGCQDIILTDTTGVWDATSNRGGWDDGSFTSLNVAISDISVIEIDVVLPDGNVKVLTVATGGIFPGIGTNPFYRITAAMLGITSGPKPDGLVTIRLKITCNTFQGSPVSPHIVFFVDLQFIWLCQGWCCLANLATKLKHKGKCWTCKESDTFLTVYSLLRQAEWAANCPDMAEAENLRLQAKAICDDNNCNC